MCGIIGALSERSVVQSVIRGLGELQNRGYDSMGVSFVHPKGITVHKDVCTPHSQFLLSLGHSLSSITYHNGIGHTRWATHGGITRQNAHPHVCYQGLFSLVHNGIIENFLDIRGRLGVPSQSDTDSEVIVNLISYLYSQNPCTDPYKGVGDAICRACQQLQGTFGLVIQCALLPDCIFCIRWGSPLWVGRGTDMVMVVSEKSAFDTNITKYTMIDNHDLVVLHNSLTIDRLSSTEEYVMTEVTICQEEDNTGCLTTWTEKEIMDQPEAILRSINNGSRITHGVQLGGLRAVMPQILCTDHILLIGCGTSYHACLLAGTYFRQLTHLQTVQVCDASEFEPLLVPKKGNTCLIVVSQSGETMDVMVALQTFRQTHPTGLVLGVINVVDSMIACQVDAGVYTNCGKERGVASTKSFSCQSIVLFLIASFFGGTRDYLDSLLTLPTRISTLLPRVFHHVDKVLCAYVSQFDNIFIVGKSFDHVIAMEAALKIKEISYIHSEAYSSSSLKHGPFALLNPQMLVILISTIPSERRRIENAYQEIHSRGSPLVVISYENIQHCPYYVPVSRGHFSYLEANTVLQILALRLSLAKGIHPDYPRNLAKVVTVE